MGKPPLLKKRFLVSASVRRIRAAALTIVALAYLLIGIPAAVAVEVVALYTAQVALDEEADLSLIHI